MSANLPTFGPLSYQAIGSGIQTDLGQLIQQGARINYVRSTGFQAGDEQMPGFNSRIMLTINSAASECRAGFGDVIVCLPGHSETVGASDLLTNLVAGTRIIGLGDPAQDDAPTLNWNATTSKLALSVKNVEIRNMRMTMDGANGVVKAIEITAARVKLIGNYMRWASGAALKATIAIEVGSGATDCLIANNYITGTATHNVTDGIKVVGGTVPNRLTIVDNIAIASATAANGLIHVTVAALNFLIRGNILYNTHTSSTAAIALDDTACDGIIDGNRIGVKNNGTAASQGITFGTAALAVCGLNYTCDEAQKSGALSPAAAT